MSESSSAMDEPMDDELIACIAPTVLPARDMRAVAYEVLGLTQEQVDAECFTPSMINDTIYHCLRLGMQRQRIHTVEQLSRVLERASRDDVITTDAIRYIESLNQPTLQQVCSNIIKYISPKVLQQLFCGYFGLTLPEVEQQQPQPLDHRTSCIRILSLWRRLNPGRNSGKHLLQAFQNIAVDAIEEEGLCVVDEYLSNSNGGLETFVMCKEIVDALYQKLEENIGKGSSDLDTCKIEHKRTDTAIATETLLLKLKDRYTEDYHTLNPLPWVSTIEASILNDVFITLYVDDEEQSTTISMNDLFTQNTKSSLNLAKLILLHGEAGSGKTTLTCKIALDWATGHTSINKLLDFTAVFIIKASLVEEQDTFAAYLEREYLPKSLSNIDIEKDWSNLKVLIVIDGYDERQSKQDFIQSILSRKLLPQATVLLTSRYGATQAIRNQFKFIASLRGFTRSDIKSFVEKHASQETKRNFLEMYATNHPFVDTLSNPLYLWIFVILGDDYFQDIQTFTRTDFYSQTLLGISDKAKRKLCTNTFIEEDVVDEAIDKLCVLAYQCMKKDALQIKDTSAVDSTMAKLGLLNAIISRSGIRDKKVFVFAHKTIMEFLAAKHIAAATLPPKRSVLARIFKKKTNTLPAIKHLLMFPEVADLKRRNASVVIAFVLGLLKDNRNSVAEIIKELIPNASNRGKHEDHLALSCFCEIGDISWFPSEILEGRFSTEIHLDNQCTPYCIRGLEMYSQLRKLENLIIREYATPPTSPINVQSCTVERCAFSLVMMYSIALGETSEVNIVYKDRVDEVKLWAKKSDEPGVTVRISDVTVTAQQFVDMTRAFSACSHVDAVAMYNLQLKGGLTSAHEPYSCLLPSLKHLSLLGDKTSSELTAVLLRLWLDKTEVVELERVHISDDGIFPIDNSMFESPSPSHLKLKWLPEKGICRLLWGLQNAHSLRNLVELEVWCLSVDDCAAVGAVVPECSKLQKFSWRSKEITESAIPGFCISAPANKISVMWYTIATRAVHIHTVCVQEFVNGWDWGRVDDVFLSVLRHKLTPEQRQAIQWRVVHLIDKEKDTCITSEECREVYGLLPSVQEMWRGRKDVGDEGMVLEAR